MCQFDKTKKYDSILPRDSGKNFKLYSTKSKITSFVLATIILGSTAIRIGIAIKNNSKKTDFTAEQIIGKEKYSVTLNLSHEISSYIEVSEKLNKFMKSNKLDIWEEELKIEAENV